MTTTGFAIQIDTTAFTASTTYYLSYWCGGY
jgi:hypothetical protein